MLSADCRLLTVAFVTAISPAVKPVTASVKVAVTVNGWLTGEAVAVERVTPDTPVFMLTGWGHRLAAEGDVPAEVDRVLNKPPKLRDLREVLATVKSRSTP